jgi:hypothetical protein
MPKNIYNSPHLGLAFKLHALSDSHCNQPKPVPLYHFARHSHSSSTSNFHPRLSLGNLPIQLSQMRSETPIPSAQVKHALSGSPLYER